MSLIHRARSLARHRAKTPAELRAALDSATCLIISLTTEIDELTGHRAELERQLDEAGIDYSGALEDLRITHGHLTQTEQAIRDRDQTIAELTRRLAIGVRAETIVAATQPIRTLTERFEQGPVRRLGAVTDPGDSSGETTQSLRIVQGVT